MKNYNMTVKNALVFIEGVEKLKKNKSYRIKRNKRLYGITDFKKGIHREYIKV